MHPQQRSGAVSNVVATCLTFVLSDEAWQDIGFPRRPRFGAFFQRFRPKWKTDLENRVTQEILAAVTAAHALAGRITFDEIPRIIAEYTASADLAAALGYSSRNEGRRRLSETIAQYCKTPIRDWNTMIANHMALNAIPDKKVSTRLLFGCIRFSENLGNMVLILRRDGSEPHKGQ